MEYIYSMEDKFSDNNFVTRREENNIRYNSKVNFPLNSYVIVENKNNNEIYEVYKSNDGIINKKDKGLFKNNHSVEKGSKYNIYFIFYSKTIFWNRNIKLGMYFRCSTFCSIRIC